MNTFTETPALPRLEVDAPRSRFTMLPLAQLHESTNNPRKRFSSAALEELTASVREHGILTPLLARPNSVVGGLFEIAAGHRRFRAATAAGLSEVPVVIREMSDQQFMEILTVENLQREDVHAYEEAQGYQELLRLPGYDVAAVAGKIGRSENYVRSRLKLLSLVSDVADAFLSGRITFAHARLIAPLSPDKQGEALKECFSNYGKRTLLPASELRDWISSEEGEDLADAPFALDDADLLPAAGACLACPKSTCGEGKLFGDAGSDDACYDKKCFELKLDAHIAAAKSNGLVAISALYGEVSPDALPRSEFTEVETRDSGDTDDDEDLPEEKACPDLEEAVVVSGHDRGRTTLICRNPKCPVHGKKAQGAAKNNSGSRQDSTEQRDWKAEREVEEKKKKAEWAKRQALYDEIVNKWAPIFDRATLFLLVVDGLDKIHHHPILVRIAEDLGVAKEADLAAQRATLYTRAEKADTLWLRSAFIQLFFAGHVQREAWDRSYDMLAIASETLKHELADRQVNPTPKPAKPKAAKKPAKKKPAKKNTAAAAHAKTSKKKVAR